MAPGNPLRPTRNVMLTLPLDKLAYIIEKAMAYDEESLGELTGGTIAEDDNAEDDDGALLFDPGHHPTGEALRAAISALDPDELADLVAVAWIGRGDYGRKEWRDARRHAAEALRRDEWRYLLGLPILADYLEEGAETLGLTVGEAIVSIH